MSHRARWWPLLVLAGSAGCGDSAARRPAWDEEPPPLVVHPNVSLDGVLVAPVIMVRAPDVVFPATVEPDPLHEVMITAPVTGTLLRVEPTRTVDQGVQVARLQHHEGQDTALSLTVADRGAWRPRKQAREFVWSGDTIGVVHVDGCWLAIGSVDEVESTVLHAGDPATVKAHGMTGEFVWSGRVERVSRAEPPRRFSARVAVEFCADGVAPRSLRASAIVTPGGAEDSLPAVPSSAMVSIDDWRVLFVPRGDGSFQVRFVLVGPTVGGNVIVRRGVDRGALVATTGLEVLATAARDSLQQRMRGSPR